MNFISSTAAAFIFLVIFGFLFYKCDSTFYLRIENPASVGFSSSRLERLSVSIDRYLEENESPGVITAILKDGKLVYYKVHGYSNIEEKAVLKSDSIFRIFSMTKPIVGVAIMMLYEQGYFRLDDPVSDFIPAFKTARVYSEKGYVSLTSPLTFRHLLTHTSGITDAYKNNPVSRQYKNAGLDASWRTMASQTTLEDYVNKLAEQPLLFQPGSQWHYGMNISVLGRLVEVISGRPLNEYLQDSIFQPLKMKDTDYFVSDDNKHRLVSIYKNQGDDLVDVSDAWSHDSLPSLTMGDSGLVSTMEDYLRFTMMLLNGGELEGVRLLSPTTVNLMTANHLPKTLGPGPLRTAKGYPTADRFGMGHGLTMAVVTDAVAAGSAGSDGEFTWGGAACTDFWVDPERKIIGLIFTQHLVCWERFALRSLMHQMVYQALVED